jgi:hypothetical protein
MTPQDMNPKTNLISTEELEHLVELHSRPSSRLSEFERACLLRGAQDELQERHYAWSSGFQYSDPVERLAEELEDRNERISDLKDDLRAARSELTWANKPQEAAK